MDADRRLVALVGFALLCLRAHSAPAAPAHRVEGELLQAPSFEQWEEGRAVAWEAQVGKVAAEQQHLRSGTRAIRIAAVKHGRYNTARLYYHTYVPLRPRTDYVFSVWARGRGDIRLHLADAGDKGYIGAMVTHRAVLGDEWKQYQFAYSAPDDSKVKLKPGLLLDGVAGFAIIDDASLAATGPAASAPPNLVTNGDCNADANNDGRPDGWTFSPMAKPQAIRDTGPDGSPGARFQYAPPAKPSGPAFDPKTWWQWRSQQGGAPTWVAAIASPTVPVEPGHTYRIRYQFRGEGMRLHHTKLFWLRDGTRTLRWRTLGPKREDRWNWQQETITLTAPPADVSALRIAYWALAGGGRLWVDNLSVQRVSVRPVSAHTDVAEAEPVPNVKPLPARLPSPDIRYSRVGSGAPGPREAEASRVSIDAQGITVRLRTGIVLRMPRTRGNELLGVTRVRLGELDLRNPAAPAIAPVFDGLDAQRCRFVSAEVRDGRDCIVHTALEGPAGSAQLDWIFKPAEEQVAGRRYVGFAYQYALKTDRAKIDQVMDRATWELGGSPMGTTVIAQNSGAIENVFHLSMKDTYCTGSGVRFAIGDGIEYQMNPHGALAYFYTDPVPFVRYNRSGTREWIVYRDTPQYAGATQLTTPLKSVLFCPRAGHDEWTYLHDHVYAKHAAFYGIEPAQPLPIANAWLGWWDMPKRDGHIYYKDLLRDFADKVVPRVADMGFGIFAVHGVWSHGGCSPDVLEIGPEFGGDAALRYLCDAAKKRGMAVQVWSTTAHLWQHSRLFKEHPSWRIAGADGKPPTTYCYPTIRGASFPDGFADYAAKQYRHVRESTGLGCLWLDSYCNFTHNIRCADRGFHLRQAEGVFKHHGRLSRMGYNVYTESRGTFGVPACGLPIGNLGAGEPVLPEPYTRYHTSCYIGAGGTPSREGEAIERVRAICAGDYYYRVLANRGTLMILWRYFKDMKESQAKIAQANRDYNAVIDHMHVRHSLPNDLGVEWSNPRNSDRVLFCYREHRCTRPRLSRVTDVTTGRDVPVIDGGFVATPQHTYRLTFAGRR